MSILSLQEEIIPLKLLSLSQNTYPDSEFDLTQCFPNEEVFKSVKSSILSLYKKFKKDGKITTNYTFSKDSKGFGRLYPENGCSIGMMDRSIRSFLGRDFYHDIDIKKCHWNLVKFWFKTYEIECAELSVLLEKWDSIVDTCLKIIETNRENFKDLKVHIKAVKTEKLWTELNKGDIKSQLCAMLNSESVNEIAFNLFFQKPFEFIEKLHNKIYTRLVPILKERYPAVWSIASKSKENKSGKFLSICLQDFEREIVVDCMKFVQGAEVYIYDGFFVRKDCVEDLEEFCTRCNERALEKFGIEVEYVCKEFTEYPDVFDSAFNNYNEDEWEFKIGKGFSHIKVEKESKREKKDFEILTDKLVQIYEKRQFRIDPQNFSVFERDENHPFVFNMVFEDYDELIRTFFNDDEVYNKNCLRYFDFLVSILKKRCKINFKPLTFDMNVIAFKNGCLFLKEKKFIELSELSNEKVHNPARKFINLDFDISNTSTPLLDDLLEFQLGDRDDYKEIRNTIYSLMGRILYAPDDGLQVVPWLKGKKNCGKSTINAILKEFFNDGEVGTFNTTQEQTFGLDSLRKYKAIITTEIPEEISKVLAVDLFKSIASGESVSCARKQQSSISVKWTVPMFIIGNYLPDYSNDQGAISKRIAIIKFDKVIEGDKVDKDYVKKIVKEVPNIIWKCNYYYRDLIDNSKGNFENVRPNYFLETEEEYLKHNDTMLRFLEQPSYDDKNGFTHNIIITGDERDHILLDRLEDQYKYFCSYKKIRANWNKQDDSIFRNLGLVKKNIKVCKHCNAIPNIKKGGRCCERYNSAQRLNRDVLFGLKFVKEKVNNGKVLENYTFSTGIPVELQ